MNKNISFCILIIISALFFEVISAATICREQNISGYDQNKLRAKSYVPFNNTRTSEGLAIYIEIDKYGNPYYQSNFISRKSSDSSYYHFPTKIGGKSRPLFDFDAAFAQIIYDDVTIDNLNVRIMKAKNNYLRKTTVYINQNIFKNGVSLISSKFLSDFIIVNPNKPIKQNENGVKLKGDGGLNYCEVIANCLKGNNNYVSCGEILGLSGNVVSGIKSLCTRR